MTTVEQLPTMLPAVECASWCRDGDGHVDEWHPTDQRCDSDGEVVGLTKYPLVKMSSTESRINWLEVHVQRDPGSIAEVQVLREGEGGFSLRLTPAEAKQFGAALIAQASLND